MTITHNNTTPNINDKHISTILVHTTTNNDNKHEELNNHKFGMHHHTIIKHKYAC